MSLFQSNDIQAIENKSVNKQSDKQATKAGSYIFETQGIQLIGESYRHLKTHLGELERDKVYEYYTDGAWSLHQLIEHISLQIGASNMWLTSYSISEKPVRRLLELKEKGLIRNLVCLLDTRAKDRKGEAFQLLSTFAQITMVELHAKVAIFENEDWGVSILTSQNLTKNRRIEAGTIHSNKQSAHFHKNWILQKIQAEHERIKS